MDLDKKRKVEVVVVSDFHLGTMACNASELLHYLKSIAPRTLVLNGDIIDAWRFSRNYFPKSHMKIIRYIIKLMEKGTKVVYITGNHDEVFRKFEKTQAGNFKIVNQLELELDREKTWILHGDIFDPVVYKMRWLSKLGAAIYGFLSLVNSGINLIYKPITGQKIKIYKIIKQSFSFKTSNITRFEKMACQIADKKNYKQIICGHTHIPAEKIISVGNNKIKYLNCGDWVENNSAVEYYKGQWKLEFFHEKAERVKTKTDDNLIENPKQIFQIISAI